MAEQTAEKPREPAPAPPPEPVAAAGSRPFKIRSEQLVFFNRQIASMARLNMPLAKGLRILAR
jgi:type II secretory pathway component PulF